MADTISGRAAAAITAATIFPTVTTGAADPNTKTTGAGIAAFAVQGTYTPTINGGPVNFLTTGSTVTGATNEGIRAALVSLFATNVENLDTAVLSIDTIHNTANPAAFIRTGIHIKSFTAPDNGGESSGILSVSTGGGPAATFYHAPLLRPAGFPNYANTVQPALEVATGGGNAAILVTSGATIGGAATGRSAAINVQVDGGALNCDGIIIQPGDGATFDARNAWVVGARQTNAAPVLVKAYLLLNGDCSVLRMGVGTATPGVVVGGQATTFASSGYASLDGIRFRGTDADNSIFQNNANALGITTDGQPIHLGTALATKHLYISTAGNVGVGVETFGTNAAGVLAVKNGTAPTTGPADTVQFYSSDNSAGHTIPSFFCEGTEVLATGQADSVSSVRVKVRVNGTVVTLLGI